MASIGADPCVKVGEPDSFSGNATATPIQVCDAAKAQALADVLQPSAKYLGNLESLIRMGMWSNRRNFRALRSLRRRQIPPFEVTLTTRSHIPYDALGFTPNCALVEFKPQVIEVATDNISNPYGSNSYVAAEVFILFLNSDAGGMNEGLRPVTGPSH